MKLGVVFAGPVENKKFGAEVNCRLVNASALYKKGRIDTILCVGGSNVLVDDFLNGRRIVSWDEELHHDSEAEAMRQWFRVNGIANDFLFVKGESMDTIGNLEIDAFPFLIEYESLIKELYFIGTRQHLKRIKLTLKRLLIDEIMRDGRDREISEQVKVFLDFILVTKSTFKWPDNVHFFPSGYELSIIEKIKEFVLYLLTLYDPLGRKWPWPTLRKYRKKTRLATGR